MDVNSADPIEGMIVAQLIAAHEASLALYSLGWTQQMPEHFEGRVRYLQLADKAARTMAMLSERLDQHRNRGQQQIVVKHVTVNADQASIADTLSQASPRQRRVSHRCPDKCLEKPMPNSTGQGNVIRWGGYENEMNSNPMQALMPHHGARPDQSGRASRVGTCGTRLSVCRMHGARGGAPTGKRNGNYRHGARSKETIELWKLIKRSADVRFQG